jgi:hypothetical protein
MYIIRLVFYCAAQRWQHGAGYGNDVPACAAGRVLRQQADIQVVPPRRWPGTPYVKAGIHMTSWHNCIQVP